MSNTVTPSGELTQPESLVRIACQAGRKPYLPLLSWGDRGWLRNPRSPPPDVGGVGPPLCHGANGAPRPAVPPGGGGARRLASPPNGEGERGLRVLSERVI